MGFGLQELTYTAPQGNVCLFQVVFHPDFFPGIFSMSSFSSASLGLRLLCVTASRFSPSPSTKLSDLTMGGWPGLSQSWRGASPLAEADVASLPSSFPGETHLSWAATGHFSLCSNIN